MKLSIDTTDATKIKVKFDDEEFTTEARHDKSQKLLPFIDQLLVERQMTVNDIHEIEVSSGPGSFTGIRVGLSVAQALGFALSIPVNGQLLTEGEKLSTTYEM